MQKLVHVLLIRDKTPHYLLFIYALYACSVKPCTVRQSPT